MKHFTLFVFLAFVLAFAFSVAAATSTSLENSDLVWSGKVSPAQVIDAWKKHAGVSEEQLQIEATAYGTLAPDTTSPKGPGLCLYHVGSDPKASAWTADTETCVPTDLIQKINANRDAEKQLESDPGACNYLSDNGPAFDYYLLNMKCSVKCEFNENLRFFPHVLSCIDDFTVLREAFNSNSFDASKRPGYLLLDKCPTQSAKGIAFCRAPPNVFWDWFTSPVRTVKYYANQRNMVVLEIHRGGTVNANSGGSPPIPLAQYNLNVYGGYDVNNNWQTSGVTGFQILMAGLDIQDSSFLSQSGAYQPGSELCQQNTCIRLYWNSGSGSDLYIALYAKSLTYVTTDPLLHIRGYPFEPPA